MILIYQCRSLQQGLTTKNSHLPNMGLIEVRGNSDVLAFQTGTDSTGYSTRLVFGKRNLLSISYVQVRKYHPVNSTPFCVCYNQSCNICNLCRSQLILNLISTNHYRPFILDSRWRSLVVLTPTANALPHNIFWLSLINCLS